jgi:hypothetical protein
MLFSLKSIQLTVFIKCLMCVWALLSVLMQWMIFGMPGISVIGPPTPEFLVEIQTALIDFFSGQHIY